MQHTQQRDKSIITEFKNDATHLCIQIANFWILKYHLCQKNIHTLWINEAKCKLQQYANNTKTRTHQEMR